MLKIEIPPCRVLELHHLVLDYNGTIARDGILLPGVAEKINELSIVLTVHVVTADTFGTVHEQMSKLICIVAQLSSTDHTLEKGAYINSLGADRCICVGNGMNDQLMLSDSAVSIGIIGHEGAALAALQNADIIVSDVINAFDLLLQPKRLIATLRR